MMLKSCAADQFSWTIDLDFVRDYREIAASRLVGMGYTYSSIENAPIEYFNVQNMLITAKPRKIMISNELSCPTGYETIFNELVEVMRNGNSLNPYLSKRTKNSSNKDLLLW